MQGQDGVTNIMLLSKLNKLETTIARLEKLVCTLVNEGEYNGYVTIEGKKYPISLKKFTGIRVLPEHYIKPKSNSKKNVHSEPTLMDLISQDDDPFHNF